jgi:hypothetical protein
MEIMESIYWTLLAGNFNIRFPAFAGERLFQDALMASEAKFLIVQFLEWIGARPRSVAEVRAAWSSTCPLNCAWEDALAGNMVVLTGDGRVVLTALGQAQLEARQ